MKIPSPLPGQLALAAFTFQEAVDAGVSFRRLRHVSLHSPSRGIRVPGHDFLTDLECGPRQDVVRPFSQVTGFSAASHATAFILWGFPGFLPGSNAGLIHISRPDTMAIPRRRGVTGHVGQFFADEIVSLDGLRITTRARTWLDCSRRMSVEEITVVADHLLRMPRPEFEGRSEPYATTGDLAQMLDRHKGTPGIQKARLALDRSRVGADSAPETRLRLALEDEGLPEPELKVRTNLGGGVVRQPDLSYPDYKVAVEYDGEGRSDAAQIVRDIAREEDFGRAGWLQVRISKLHMRHGAGAAVRKITDALVARGWAAR